MPSLRSLAGDESNEPKDRQLPTLWEDSVRRPLEREAFCDTANNQVPSMRLPEGMEKRNATNASGKTATLHLPKLCLRILKVVKSPIHTLLFLLGDFFELLQSVAEVQILRGFLGVLSGAM